MRTISYIVIVMSVPPKGPYRKTKIKVSSKTNEYYRQYYHLYVKTGKRGRRKK